MELPLQLGPSGVTLKLMEIINFRQFNEELTPVRTGNFSNSSSRSQLFSRSSSSSRVRKVASAEDTSEAAAESGAGKTGQASRKGGDVARGCYDSARTRWCCPPSIFFHIGLREDSYFCLWSNEGIHRGIP